MTLVPSRSTSKDATDPHLDAPDVLAFDPGRALPGRNELLEIEIGPDDVLELDDGAAHLRPPSTLPQPGIFEQFLVVLVTFVLYHQTPNVWSYTALNSPEDLSNPVASGLQFVLILLAFARVAGSIDYLIQMVRLELSVFGFTLLAFASVFWSANPALTVQKAVMFVAVTAFAGYLVLRFSLERIMTLLAFMFVISGIVNLGWILAFPETGIDPAGRLTGVFQQKNALGYANALAIPTLVLAAVAVRRARLLFIAFAVLHSVLLVGSESKTMLIAGFGPTALISVYHLFRSRKTLRGAVLLSLGGIGVFTLAFATANIGVLAAWLDKDVSLTGRVPLWEALLPVIGERVALGHGYQAAFDGYYSPIHEVWIVSGWEPPDAHNAIVQIWLEVGLIGVVLFVATYIRALVRSIRIVAIVPGGVGLWPIVFMTSTLLFSITESGVQSENLGWTMYVVAVLSVGLHLRYRSSIGLSNEIKDATVANRLSSPVR